MKLKFIKDHVSGIGKGSIVKIDNAVHAARLIKEEFAEEEKDPKAAYKMIPSHVEDIGKKAREKKQKKALENQKKVQAQRDLKRTQEIKDDV